MLEIKKTALSVDFPMVDHFEDYHNIDDRAYLLEKMFSNKKIKSHEIGFCENGRYWGVFYIGRKPNKAAVAQLLADAAYIPMEYL